MKTYRIVVRTPGDRQAGQDRVVSRLVGPIFRDAQTAWDSIDEYEKAAEEEGGKRGLSWTYVSVVDESGREVFPRDVPLITYKSDKTLDENDLPLPF